MSTWLDKLSDHGATKVKEKKKRIGPRPVVHEVYVIVRHSSGADPGQIDIGHFIVVDGLVILTDQEGDRLKDGPSHIVGDCDPRYIAQMLLRQRRSEKGSDFNRDLRPYYRDRGIV
jgi:hypothetical protein